jgi:hypothetical protein
VSPAWACLEEVDKFGNRKRAFRRASNRNIIVKTVFLTVALVGEDGRIDYDQVYVLRFYGKGLAHLTERFTKPLDRRSMRIRGDDGVLYKPPLFGVIVQITSTLESNNWGDCVPTLEIVAKYGAAGGPTADEFATALEMYKEREAWAALSYDPTPGVLEPPAPPLDALALGQSVEQPSKPGVTPTPKLGSPEAASSRLTTGPAARAVGAGAGVAFRPDAGRSWVYSAVQKGKVRNRGGFGGHPDRPHA